MELTSSGSGSRSAPTSDLFAWHFGGDECHLTSLCACFLCGGGRVNHTVVLYGHLNPLTLPQRAKNKLEPSEQLNPVQSKPWPSAFIQSPERQAHALRLCGCVSLFLPQHDLFLLLGVFLLVSLMSSALQIGSPADRPCSAVRLGGSLGAQAKARQQPVQHIPARVSASLSLSCFPLPPKQALLPTLSLRHVFWVVMVPGGGKGGVHLEEVSWHLYLIPAALLFFIPTSSLPQAMPVLLQVTHLKYPLFSAPSSSLSIPPVLMSWGLWVSQKLWGDKDNREGMTALWLIYIG